MNLDLTPEQEMIRDVVRGVCAQSCPIATVRALEDDPAGYAPEFWKQLAELGLLGILVPERFGGAGQGMLEAAVLYEELGRSLAPSPHFPSAVLGAGALVRAGSEEQRTHWLPKIASGEAILVPAWLEPDGSFVPEGVRVRAERAGAGYRISGVKRHVPFAAAATRLVVLARTGEAPGDVDLFLVDPAAPGVRLVQQKSLASDTQYRVELDGVTVSEEDRIGPARSGWATWDDVMHDGAILQAAWAMGGAARALEMTVEFARERKQFGKPIGAFQAISHYLADATTQVDGGRTLAYEAAWARAQGRPVDRLAPMAKLFAGQTYRDVTAMAQQVYGGIGFTVEMDIQLYFRRAKQLQLSWWDARECEARIARAVLDAPPERARVGA